MYNNFWDWPPKIMEPASVKMQLNAWLVIIWKDLKSNDLLPMAEGYHCVSCNSLTIFFGVLDQMELCLFSKIVFSDFWPFIHLGITCALKLYFSRVFYKSINSSRGIPAVRNKVRISYLIWISFKFKFFQRFCLTSSTLIQLLKVYALCAVLTFMCKYMIDKC